MRSVQAVVYCRIGRTRDDASTKESFLERSNVKAIREGTVFGAYLDTDSFVVRAERFSRVCLVHAANSSYRVSL